MMWCSPHTLACFAGDIAWLCYELGVYRPVAVGHGIGAAIAVQLAAGYPDLLAAVVALDASIVLLPEVGAATKDAGLAAPYLAATFEQVAVVDETARWASCPVPMLYVASKMPRPDPARLRRLRPGSVLQSVRLDHPDRLDVGQINAAVEAFLVSLAAPDIPER